MHPGLGVGPEIEYLIVELANRSQRDGILNIPEHWYNAVLYSRAMRPYHFLNPAFEGFFLSITAALQPEIASRGLAIVAWAIFRGLLCCMPPLDPGVSHGEDSLVIRRPVRVRWVPQEQVCPLTGRLGEYFDSPRYRDAVRKYYRPELFSILWDVPESELSSSCPDLSKITVHT
jgi:hypothetical protein